MLEKESGAPAFSLACFLSQETCQHNIAFPRFSLKGPFSQGDLCSSHYQFLQYGYTSTLTQILCAL